MTDAVTTWLNAAGRYPLLPKSEVIRIARKIQKSEPGSPQRARWVNKLCVHNLRLVVNYTRNYMRGNRRVNWGSEVTSDYLQVAYFGLRRAAEKFDPERGYTFATYASAWVRQALGRYHVENISMVRVPESSAREIFFFDTHGYPRTEAAAKWVPYASQCAQRAYSIRSYDAAVNDDGDLLDVLSDENRLVDTTEEDAFAKVIDTAGIMSAVGIEPRIQDLIMQYVKRGNLDTVLMKNKCNSKETRLKIRCGIEKIKKHCGTA